MMKYNGLLQVRLSTQEKYTSAICVSLLQDNVFVFAKQCIQDFLIYELLESLRDQ